ncbi:MAG TPA: AAA family ATPase [Kofleriaceae bacterium]|jgi:ATP-dependent Clp protease ATP-binding subunit ClpA/ATP-dependent Clp protease ATP-binding subunit ClpC
MIDFTIGVYQARKEGEEHWTALIPAPHEATVSGTGEPKLRERMIDRLRAFLRISPPVKQELFQFSVGTELMRISVDVKLTHGRLHGQFPLVVEPRWTHENTQQLVCYHPTHREAWFVVTERDEISLLLPVFLRQQFDDSASNVLEELVTDGKDRLAFISFSAESMSLLDMLPSRKKDARQGAGAERSDVVLKDLAVDETRVVSTTEVSMGTPRSPYRERLQYLLGGNRPRSVAVVGPPGSGKTTLIRQWVSDRVDEDGYGLHHNLDRVHHVWRITGKRIIAGMSYLGQWEERCLSILEDARKHRGILWIEDLHLWGRLGQSRQSERSFADFFRGPVRRGDLAIIAEMTQPQFARLERDAPGLAEALALVAVPAASAAETSQLLLSSVREIERETYVSMHPFVPRTALELGSALFPWRARPGVAIEIVKRMADDHYDDDVEIMPADVLKDLARITGLSPSLISLDEALDPVLVEETFTRRVIGQPVATRAAADVVLRVRAGMADPNRPVNVMLFTGPTGTGKTELATAIAEYLYGGGDRLVRLDMGELSGRDAVARLIGDGVTEGMLTSRVRSQPFCVVLLDEIEKAHPQALHLLLQLFDEGRLTDANGEVASFASAVVIMTSNLGSKTSSPIGFGDLRERVLGEVAKAVREFFPIELFNRIDQVVPFGPLTHDVAEKVVDKELAKLLGRRGLRERNTFVYAGTAVKKRAVTDAFDPRYGARTVKRWLEDRIGGVLTDLLAGAPPARLRIVRLADDNGRITATLEPLEERKPTPGPFSLEGALDVATSALEPTVARAVAALERIAASPVLAEARAKATGDLRYYVDALGLRLTGLAELFGVRAAARVTRDVEDDNEDTDYDYFESGKGMDRRSHRVRARSAHSRVAGPPASRDALIAGIAETMMIERVLPTLLDPDAHAVTVVISRVGNTVDANGISVIATSLEQPGWLDDRAPAAGQQHRDLVYVLRSLFIRATLDGDHGTWMVRSTAAEPDVVRVEVRSGAGKKAADVLAAHLAARTELERVLEQGGAIPPNPDALLPVTRSVTYRTPMRPGDSFHVELEDFATGWSDTGAHKTIMLAIDRARFLGMSRTGDAT